MFPTSFTSLQQFQQHLNYFINESSHRSLFIQWTATWCGRCKSIKHLTQQLQKTLPTDCEFVVLDIEQNMEVYSFFKSKKMISGVPCFFRYDKPCSSLIPNNVLLGANQQEIQLFFKG